MAVCRETSRWCICNFGNGYFGTTAVSSAGTNASNNGIFEYDVPTGYTALSTKGLNFIMAYTTINKSTDYFNTKLYTGNGSTQSLQVLIFNQI